MKRRPYPFPEPPVQILSPSQSQMELCQQTSERMVLSCEISRPNAVVRWYRDGLEVEESENLLLEVDGVYRRLIIPETTVKDSAEYVCDTGDDSVTFFVNIAGKETVKITHLLQYFHFLTFPGFLNVQNLLCGLCAHGRWRAELRKWLVRLWFWTARFPGQTPR